MPTVAEGLVLLFTSLFLFFLLYFLIRLFEAIALWINKRK